MPPGKLNGPSSIATLLHQEGLHAAFFHHIIITIEGIVSHAIMDKPSSHCQHHR